MSGSAVGLFLPPTRFPLRVAIACSLFVDRDIFDQKSRQLVFNIGNVFFGLYNLPGPLDPLFPNEYYALGSHAVLTFPQAYGLPNARDQTMESLS